LANVTAMHTENVPIVRSGTLGRLHQTGVRILWPDRTTHSITAHLIDCRSHQGFSGSPCYVQLEPRGRTDVREWDTYLLGLITGHLDELGAEQRVQNSGVGLVTTVEAICQVLMQEWPRAVHEAGLGRDASVQVRGERRTSTLLTGPLSGATTCYRAF